MDDAVVLTLRRRHSSLRKGASRRASRRASRALLSAIDASPSEAEASTSTSSTPAAPSAEDALANPWHEAPSAPRPRRAMTAPSPLHHRLSFDDASGVIMLPDDDWLDEEESSDSDEEISDGPTPSVAQSPETSQATDVPFPATETQALLPRSPSKRYATYYHHPERRRTQTMPGAYAA
jgi:calcium permeable stress-gated cation channel